MRTKLEDSLLKELSVEPDISITLKNPVIFSALYSNYFSVLRNKKLKQALVKLNESM